MFYSRIAPVFLVVAFCVHTSARADDDPQTHSVCASGGGCSFTSIREAINSPSVKNGDTLQLHAETYTEGHHINTNGKEITIKGTVDAQGNPTSVISGEFLYQVFVINSGEGSGTVLDSLDIRNGVGPDLTHVSGGLEISGSNPYIRNCVFRNNTAYIPPTGPVKNFPKGGAVYIHSNSSTSFYKCTFIGNSCLAGSGGALGCVDSTVSLEDCHFLHNGAMLSGGGVYLSSTTKNHHANLTSCQFKNNFTTGAGVGNGFGGGGICTFFFNCNIELCTLTNNHTMVGGGGVSVNGGNCSISRSTITKNSSADDSPTGVMNFLNFATLSVDRTLICGNYTPLYTCDSTGVPPQITPGFTDGGGNCIQCNCTDCGDLSGDFDQDGDVDLDDYNALGAALGTCPGDVNGDGVIDGADIGLLISAWGTCF